MFDRKSLRLFLNAEVVITGVLGLLVGLLLAIMVDPNHPNIKAWSINGYFIFGIVVGIGVISGIVVGTIVRAVVISLNIERIFKQQLTNVLFLTDEPRLLKLLHTISSAWGQVSSVDESGLLRKIAREHFLTYLQALLGKFDERGMDLRRIISTVHPISEIPLEIVVNLLQSAAKSAEESFEAVFFVNHSTALTFLQFPDYMHIVEDNIALRGTHARVRYALFTDKSPDEKSVELYEQVSRMHHQMTIIPVLFDKWVPEEFSHKSSISPDEYKDLDFAVIDDKYCIEVGFRRSDNRPDAVPHGNTPAKLIVVEKVSMIKLTSADFKKRTLINKLRAIANDKKAVESCRAKLEAHKKELKKVAQKLVNKV